MATFIDKDYRPHSYFWGGRGNDQITLNGVEGVTAFGGDGDDIVMGGIPYDTNGDGKIAYTLLYGGVSLPGFGHPDAVTFGRPGVIGSLDHDGRDQIHGGAGFEGKGGSDGDLYVNHGFGVPGMPFKVLHFAPGEGDRLQVDHSAGWSISGVKVKSTFVQNGHKFAEIDQFLFTGKSLDHRPDRLVQLGFHDDGRGPAAAHHFIVDNTGQTIKEAVIETVHDGMLAGHQSHDLGNSDFFIF